MLCLKSIYRAIGGSLMASGFKSPRVQAKSSKALIIANATALTEQMKSFFSEIKDPRVPRTRAHLLTDILIIEILSAIALWSGMGGYGKLWVEQN